ncbi:MAG: GNAT family N-acetyltransferase [Cyanobacteria bacterium P01_D01_bin.71]
MRQWASPLRRSLSKLMIDCCAWVAELNQQPVGFAIAHAAEATIFGIFVRPAFERQGIGHALMQAAEIWLLTGNDPTLRALWFLSAPQLASGRRCPGWRFCWRNEIYQATRQSTHSE